MAQVNELRGRVVTKEEADEFVKNYKPGEPIPQEYVDYAMQWAEDHLAKLEAFNAEIRRALNLK